MKREHSTPEKAVLSSLAPSTLMSFADLHTRTGATADAFEVQLFAMEMTKLLWELFMQVKDDSGGMIDQIVYDIKDTKLIPQLAISSSEKF